MKQPFWLALYVLSLPACGNSPKEPADGAPDPGGAASGASSVFSAIASGAAHTCAAHTETGRAVCWGDDSHGQASPPDDRPVSLLVAGETYTCGLVAEDQSVTCWGDERVTSMTPESSVSFATLVGGRLHVCGLTDAGQAMCWGANDQGQSAPPSGVAFRLLSAGATHSCGVRLEDGLLQCWGANDAGQTSAPSDQVFVAVEAGAQQTCGLTEDGTAACWGTGPEPPEGTRFSHLGLGDGFGCGVAEDGKLTCWGNNSEGQTDAPQDGKYTNLALGGEHACATHVVTGKLVCWGSNAAGQAKSPNCDVDSDGDGQDDCEDVCRRDPAKVLPENCGCGNADKDQDNDGVQDCHDECPMERYKTVPGACGCERSDRDTDRDGEPDCVDLDDDGDFVVDSEDARPQEAFRCEDTDGDGCDDCSSSGPPSVSADGPDEDKDGICEVACATAPEALTFFDQLSLWLRPQPATFDARTDAVIWRDSLETGHDVAVAGNVSLPKLESGAHPFLDAVVMGGEPNAGFTRQLPDIQQFTDLDGVSMFVIAKVTGFDKTIRMASLGFSGGGMRLSGSLHVNTLLGVEWAGLGANGPFLGETVADQWMLYSCRVGDTRSSESRVNGRVASSTDRRGSLDATRTYLLNIGENLLGHIGEVMVFRRYLEDEEMESVEQYLEQKWLDVAGPFCFTP